MICVHRNRPAERFRPSNIFICKKTVIVNAGGREKTKNLTVSSKGEPSMMWKKRIFSRRWKVVTSFFHLGRWCTVKTDPDFNLRWADRAENLVDGRVQYMAIGSSYMKLRIHRVGTLIFLRSGWPILMGKKSPKKEKYDQMIRSCGRIGLRY